MATEVKLFVGKPENVERAFKRWADEEGGPRQLITILSLQPGDGQVGFMIMYATGAIAASKIMPVNGMPN